MPGNYQHVSLEEGNGLLQFRGFAWVRPRDYASSFG